MNLSQQVCAGLWQAIPDAILVSDGQGRLVLVNERAERLFGYGPGELAGRPAQKLFPKATPELRAAPGLPGAGGQDR